MAKKYDYVLGQNKYDCGIASIMTILLYYGIKASREEIIKKYRKTDNGYTAYDLIKIAKSYSLDGYGIKSNIKEINNNKYNELIIKIYKYKSNNNIIEGSIISNRIKLIQIFTSIYT